jgi:hypothetical protein
MMELNFLANALWFVFMLKISRFFIFKLATGLITMENFQF